MSNLLRLGRNSSDTAKPENFLSCVVTCVNHSRTLSVFPNMVLGKTEYSNAVNARYTFQLLMSFWYRNQHLRSSKELGDRVEEGKAYSNFGSVYDRLGDFKHAMEYRKQCLSIAKEPGGNGGEGDGFGNLGIPYRRLADFKQAIKYHNQQLTIAREVRDRAGEGAAYGNLGNSYYRQGDFKQAIEYHSQHLCIAKEMRDRAGEGTAYDNLGNAYNRLGDLRQAVEYHNQHLSIAKELKDRAGEGNAYVNLGCDYLDLGDLKQSIGYHNQHLSIAKELGNRDGEGRAYGNLGNDYLSLGDAKKAINYHNQQCSIAKELGNRAMEGIAYGNLGCAYQFLSDFKQAIECHSKHLSIAKELNDWDGQGKAYGNLGNAYKRLGDFKQAMEYHNRHLSIAKELNDKAGEGQAYGNLGNAYLCLGYFQQAIGYHERHLSIAKERSDRAGVGRASGNLGICYQMLGDVRQAIHYHDHQLSIAKELEKKDGEGRAYGNLGDDYQSLGDFKQAIEYHNQHLTIAKNLGDRAGEGRSNGSLGNAYKCLGDIKQAIEHHNKDLSIAKELGDRAEEGRCYGNLGSAYHSLGDFKQAIVYHNQTLSITKELGDRAQEGACYGHLGRAYCSLGDLKQAIECDNQFRSIAKELGSTRLEGAACFAIGCNFVLSDALDEALGYFRYSVKLFNEVRALLQCKDAWKITFRNVCKDAYAALWKTLLRLQKVDEALCAAEQGRAQALMDLMKLQYGSKLLASDAVEPKGTISDIFTDMCTQTVFVALESNRINLWVLKDTDVHFATRSLKHATLLVEKTYKELGICVRVKCENRSLDEPEAEDELPLNTKLHQGKADCMKTSLRLLFDSVISPVAHILEGDELIIIPDGPLCLAPYAACVDEASRYFCEYTRIRILPSLTSLKLITDCPEDYHNKTGALLVGDPCVGKVKRKRKLVTISRLPWAEEEVAVIGKILDTKPLTGTDATKDEVLRRMSSVALVHIAAHGDMEAGEIALAPNPDRTSKIPKEKDYLLTMSDVQAVQLRARLVVLSCCHSAQGNVTAEGVVGIARAFLGAGARSVLVSLWAIDDEATMEFMKSFYKHLCGGCSASVALNRAMKCLRESERFGAVKYWAPFVLIGDNVTIEFAEKKSKQ